MTQADWCGTAALARIAKPLLFAAVRFIGLAREPDPGDTMNQSVLTLEQRAAYDRDGFVMVRGLFDPEEAVLLQKAMETDPQVRGNLYNRNDALGLATTLLWVGALKFKAPSRTTWWRMT